MKRTFFVVCISDHYIWWKMNVWAVIFALQIRRVVLGMSYLPRPENSNFMLLLKKVEQKSGFQCWTRCGQTWVSYQKPGCLACRWSIVMGPRLGPCERSPEACYHSQTCTCDNLCTIHPVQLQMVRHFHLHSYYHHHIQEGLIYIFHFGRQMCSLDKYLKLFEKVSLISVTYQRMKFAYYWW